ncbi:MAG: M4 family metallopeptidase [Flavobacteriales bacterium]
MRIILSFLVAFFFSISYAQKTDSTITRGYVNNNFEIKTWLSEHQFFEKNLDLESIQTFNDEIGYKHVKYFLRVNGLEVFPKRITAHYKGNALTEITGDFITLGAEFPSAVPTFENSQIIDLAKNHLKASIYDFDTDSTLLPDPELLYFQSNDSTNTYTLAYKITLCANEPLYKATLYFDAASGQLLLEYKIIKHSNTQATVSTAYSGNQTIGTYQSTTNAVFELKNMTLGGGIYTYNLFNGTNSSSASIAQSNDNLWIYNSAVDKAILDAIWGTEKTYNYYKNNHNWNSYDNLGSAMKSCVHYSTNYSNAYWNGSSMTYGDGNGTTYLPFTAIDIIGHEITHGVTQNSAALIYSGESGALNESFSDIFGSCVKYYSKPSSFNWKLAREIFVNSGCIRDMENPNAKGDPDTYQGLYWDSNGEVHTNSGVQNFWFYLLAEGGSGSNDLGNIYNVQGIGHLQCSRNRHRKSCENCF